MSISPGPSSRGASLRFRVGRVPVSIHVSSPIVLALLGPWQQLDLLVVWIAVATLSIVIHELGHFLVAKLFNVKVLKVSLGFGPKLISRTSMAGIARKESGRRRFGTCFR